MVGTPAVKRTGPMRYEYWTRNENDWIAVAIYFDRIIGVSDPAYYPECSRDPADAIYYWGDERDERVARYKLDDERHLWRYVGNAETRYLAHADGPWRSNLGEMRAELRAVLAGHRGQHGKRSHQLTIDLDESDLARWLAVTERTIIAGTGGQAGGVGKMEMSQFAGAIAFIAWMQQIGGKIVLPDTEDAMKTVEYKTDRELYLLVEQFLADRREEEAEQAEGTRG